MRDILTSFIKCCKMKSCQTGINGYDTDMCCIFIVLTAIVWKAVIYCNVGTDTYACYLAKNKKDFL